MSKRITKGDITILKDLDVIALVVEYGDRFPFLQCGDWSSNASGSRYVTFATPIRDEKLLERVLSELVTGDKVDLVIKDYFGTAGDSTLLDFTRHEESENGRKEKRRKRKLGKGMLSLLDIIQQERLEKKTEDDEQKLKISFWESTDDRVKLVRKVVGEGEEGLKAIDRLRAKRLKESVEKGRWY